MKTEVIKEMTSKELRERLEAERNHITRLRMNHAVNPLDNPVVIGQTKVIARILTELRKRELEIK